MIKNQLLNVSFDDMTSEKNKRKLLLEDLVIERDRLENQLLTSKKLMVTITLFRIINNFRVRKILSLNH